MINTEPKIAKRAIATIIDYTIFFTFDFWYIFTFGEPNDEGGYSVHGLKTLPSIAVWFLYFPICEAVFGRTLGKAIAGLTVLTKNGNTISFSQAVKRRIVDPIDIFFFGIVAIILIKNSPQHQRLGDQWAKTIVVGDETYTCPNCSEKLALSVSEIKSKKCVCQNVRRQPG